jgi:hypothetical protein
VRPLGVMHLLISPAWKMGFVANFLRIRDHQSNFSARWVLGALFEKNS